MVDNMAKVILMVFLETFCATLTPKPEKNNAEMIIGTTIGKTT
jgi:hypothetical protein